MTVPEPALVIMPTPPTTTPLMPGQPAPGKRQGWPGLWFDPAPGAPESLGTLADGLAALPSALRNARDVLAPLRGTPESWSGAAADAFASRVAELPERLDGLRRSLVAAAGTLRCWQVALAQLRARARLVEADAQVARGGGTRRSSSPRRPTHTPISPWMGDASTPTRSWPTPSAGSTPRFPTWPTPMLRCALPTPGWTPWSEALSRSARSTGPPLHEPPPLCESPPPPSHGGDPPNSRDPRPRRHPKSPPDAAPPDVAPPLDPRLVAPLPDAVPPRDVALPPVAARHRLTHAAVRRLTLQPHPTPRPPPEGTR